MDSHRRFRLAILAFLCAAAVLFSAEFLVEWVRLGMPALLGWADTNNPKLVDVLSPMARAYNNILAMLLATIGLAIPLTANMHTPKLGRATPAPKYKSDERGDVFAFKNFFSPL